MKLGELEDELRKLKFSNDTSNNGQQVIDGEIDQICALIGEGVNEGVKKTLRIILDDPGLNAVGIAERLNKSIATAERYLRTLREHDIAEFRGASKSGGYTLPKK